MNVTKIKSAMAMMADRENSAKDVAEALGISTTTLFRYVDGHGNARAPATKMLNESKPTMQ